jgi:hypothetical protein
MQKVEIKIIVEYRSDGKIDKSALHTAISNLLLSTNREELFSVCPATYARYNVAHVSSPFPKRKDVTGNGSSSLPVGAK